MSAIRRKHRKQVLFDGLDPATGQARLGPMSPAAAGRSILRRWQAGLRRPAAPREETEKGLPEGWGLVCCAGLDSRIRDALEPLLQARRGVEFPYHGELDLYSWLRNLEEEGSPLPESSMYLLLVGSPQQIPFDFQKMLTPQHLVGRLHLSDAAGYGCYVQAVLDQEAGKVPIRRADAEFYAPDDTPETYASRHELVEPLMQAVAVMAGCRALGCLGAEATRQGAIARLLGYRDEGAPAVTFLVSHGAEASGDLRARYQGSWIPRANGSWKAMWCRTIRTHWSRRWARACWAIPDRPWPT